MKNITERGAGILLPIFSLPSKYGFGTLGKEAYHFVDQLKKAGQTYWQVLPAGPTSFGDSPYQSFSSFAGNPYMIDLETLMEEGLLKKEEAEQEKWCETERKIEYDVMFQKRYPVLKKAFERFTKKMEHAFLENADISDQKEAQNYHKFLLDNEYWLTDYVCYMSIKEAHNQLEWSLWPEELKFRKKEAISAWLASHRKETDFYRFLQYEFAKQWEALHEYANKNGIRLIGDVPIYVALDSADTWSNPGQYLLDENLTPVKVAGVPPDAFSDYGQKWGNPLYDWEKMEEDGFAWWKKRMKSSAERYDVVRIDHFIGIVRYYCIPADKEPKLGSFSKGPGLKLINAINEVMGNSSVIAEDLGVVVPEVVELVRQSGYPGMKVLQFAFDGNPDNEHAPHNYEKNFAAYIGTHDNETMEGYLKNATEENISFMKQYLNVSETEEIRPAMMRLLYGSVANTAVIAMQDILGLGNEARMNLPSTIGENWRWRLLEGEFTDEMCNMLHDLARIYARLPK